MSERSEALRLVQRHKDSIQYIKKFGTPIEKAIVNVMLEVAGEV